MPVQMLFHWVLHSDGNHVWTSAKNIKFMEKKLLFFFHTHKKKKQQRGNSLCMLVINISNVVAAKLKHITLDFELFMAMDDHNIKHKQFLNKFEWHFSFHWIQFKSGRICKRWTFLFVISICLSFPYVKSVLKLKKKKKKNHAVNYLAWRNQLILILWIMKIYHRSCPQLSVADHTDTICSLIERHFNSYFICQWQEVMICCYIWQQSAA